MEPPRKKEKTKTSHDLMIPVLHASHYGMIPLVGMFVSKINPKHANTILKTLQSKYDNADISHLKRIRKVNTKEGNELWVILCTQKREKDVEQIVADCGTVFPGTEAVLHPFLHQAPEKSPLNTVQLIEAQKAWPIRVVEKSLLNPFDITQDFTEYQLETLKQHMGYALSLIENKNVQVPIAALLIDPTTLEIVAEAVDTSMDHPLHHATMNCIATRADNAKGHENYICSGLWLLLTREPCPMCAMAAVHSRVSKVFYGATNKLVGALGGKFQLHLQSELNHHYTVYKSLQGEECEQKWNEYEISLFSNQNQNQSS